MQSTFSAYLEMGMDHIMDLQAYDHMLFLVALCAIFSVKQWRPLLLLVTGFTLGHSLTLALAGLDIIRFPMDVVESLIPVTIILTAIYNFSRGPIQEGEKLGWAHYSLAIGFGLIHGMGFSNYLRAMLMPGEDGLVKQLISFNLGIELGQIAIVLVIMLISWLIIDLLGLSRRLWNSILSGLAIAISLFLLYQIHFAG